MIFKYVSIVAAIVISIFYYDFLSKNSTYIDKNKEITYLLISLGIILTFSYVFYESDFFVCMRNMGLSKTINIPTQKIFTQMYEIGFSSNSEVLLVNTLVSASIATFVASLLKISLIDIREKYVYDTTIIYSILLQFLWIILYMRYMTNPKYPLGVISGTTVIKLLLTPIISLAVAFIVSFSLYKVSGGMGQGDIGVFLIASMMFNFRGTIAMIMLSFILAGIFAVFHIVYNGYQKKLKIPFTPFIFISSIILMAGI